MPSSSEKQYVVVVDDSPTSLRFVADTLRGAGYEVATAKDGEEAIELITANPPSGIVLDILLPKKNGFQVCRELKTNPITKDVRIILLSSKRQEADRFWGQRQGADAYVTKPIHPAELTAIVNAVLSADQATTPSALHPNPSEQSPAPVTSEKTS